MDGWTKRVRVAWPIGTRDPPNAADQNAASIATNHLMPIASRARPGWVGLCAAVRDTNAATVAVRRKDGTICVVPFVWMPEREAERQNKRVPYQHWAEEGWLKLTPGDVVDYNVIFADLVEIINRYGAGRFYYDPLFQAEWLTQRLEEETGAERWEFPQRIVDYAPVVRRSSV